MYSSVISGDDWQAFVVRLLYAKHAANLIEIPDQHKGDHGIEAFTSDGCAYQCYAPEGDVGPAILADRHKKKITIDLAKFRNNEAALTKIFGNTLIARWLLVVPDHCSSDVVAHCEMKAKELRALIPPLPYLAPDFKAITVNGYDYLALQIAQFEANGGLLIEAELQQVGPEQLEQFEVDNQAWLANLDRKLLVLQRLKDEAERAAFRKKMLSYFLDGSNSITYYDERFPLIAERVRSLKDAESRSVELESMMQYLTISGTREQFRNQLSEAIPSLGKVTCDVLAYAAVVEWLMLCPLEPAG